MRKFKSLFFLVMAFSILVGLSNLVNAQLAQNRVQATLYKVDGTACTTCTLKVTKVYKNGQIVDKTTRTYTTNSSGQVLGGDGSPGFLVPRGSIAWIYTNAFGFDQKGSEGVPVSIPDAASANLETLVPSPTNLPNSYPVAVSGSATNLDALTDVVITSPANGQGLIYNGTSWVNQALAGNGTVTSVALSLPNIFSVSGSPITASGTLAATLASQNANLVFAGPGTGAAAAPTFRALVAADIPDLSAVYSPVAHTHTFASLTSKPTTLSGYGITDAAALSHTHAATDLTSGTIALARISGLTNTEISNSAAIAISKLAITGTPNGSKFLRDDGSWQAIPGGGDALTTNPLSQFASTTSAQLAGVLSNETGTGLAVFGTSPTIAGGSITGLAAFGIRSTGTGAFDLTIANTENLTAGRTLTLAVNDAARTLTVSGNATISGTNTGDQTITLTGDVTGSGTGSFAATVANNAITNAKLATMATATFKGRTTAGTGNVEDLTGTQATALLDVFTSGAKGLVPASGGGTTNFLRADGTWAAPAGAGGGITVGTTTITSGTSTRVAYNNAGIYGEISGFTSDGTNVTAGNGNLRATSPQIATGLNDVNGNAMLLFNPAASAVNQITISNAASGNQPKLAATGAGTNLSLTLAGKGVGRVILEHSPLIQDTNGSRIGFNGLTASDVMLKRSGIGLLIRLGDDSDYGFLAAGNLTATQSFTGGVLSPTSLSTNQNNYAPGASAIHRLTSSGAVDITGLDVAQADGDFGFIWNIGSNAITLKHQSASSTAANRFLSVTGSDVVLSANEIAMRWYDNTTQRWRVVELGASVGGGGSPGGSNTQLQYNNSSAFGGISGVTSDGTNITAGSGNLRATSPRFTTDISDSNGNELFLLTATASAVNEITVANAATGGSPSLTASGGDTNISLVLNAKGTGTVTVTPGLQLNGTSLRMGTGTLQGFSQEINLRGANTAAYFLGSSSGYVGIIGTHDSGFLGSQAGAFLGGGGGTPLSIIAAGSTRIQIDTSGLIGVNKNSSIGAQLHAVSGSASRIAGLFESAASATAPTLVAKAGSSHGAAVGLFEARDSADAAVFRVDMSATSGDTRLLLWDVTAGTLKRVSFHTADSCGTGFKCLRIPN